MKLFGVAIRVNGVPVNMDIHICADASIASRELWERLPRPRLRTTPRLRAYGGSEVPALGECDVDVKYKGRRLRLPLVFVDSTRERGLFAVPWITAFEAVTVNAIDSEERLSELLKEFADDFEPSTGCKKGYSGHLYFKNGAQFKINKARPVPMLIDRGSRSADSYRRRRVHDNASRGRSETKRWHPNIRRL